MKILQLNKISVGGQESGFKIPLTIECHRWGEENPMKDIHQEKLTIEISP